MVCLRVTYEMHPGKKQEFYDTIVKEGIDVASRNEPGNGKYDYELDKGDDILILNEVWENQAAFEAHCASPHFQRLQELKEKYVHDTNIEREDI